MSYSVEFIGGFNPFEWPDMKCPVCGGENFTSLSHSSVWCDRCNVRFVVRCTGGDPGCVIDCFVDNPYAPAFICPNCSLKFSSFEEDPVCPNEKCTHTGKTDKEEGIWRPYKPAKDFPTRYCLILKRGDYCSGWGACDDSVENYRGTYSAFKKKYDRDYPTQKQWDDWQDATMNIKK